MKDKHFNAIKSEFTALEKRISDNKDQDLKNHHDEIKEILEGEIASRYYYQKGRLEATFKNDREVKKAIELLTNKTVYSSILNGDGVYKVIGKPGSEVQTKANSELEDEYEN